ncbi:MAG: acetyl-CoA acetyltransferase [Actinomycetia bacterium]|nr:acetyl-CoA acetyltransferase [Actinomycetes bacterium]MCP4085580.1 acetyl-CoA acetyltransferase [Actinomycetes bacterium]
MIDPRTPVLVGVGQFIQKPEDLSESLEAVAMMEEAVRRAASDSGANGLLAKVDAVAVVQGAWKYSDPARLIADRIGSPQAHTMLTPNGGNTPQSLVNAMARRISAGRLDVAVLVGAESIWTRRRMRRAGVKIPITDQAGVEPDERFGAEVSMSSEHESDRGFDQPVNFYPTFESAFRASRGESIDDHRTRVSELWETFNAVAAENPYAWRRDRLTAQQIRSPEGGNRMVGFPYTKAMNSNWDLDQAASVIMTSAASADALGVARDRWVFPCAGTDSHDTYLVSHRDELHQSPGMRIGGRRVLELAGITVDDLAHIDLYSCFPSAAQISATEIGIPLDRQLTVTGGLTFAGGPLNNYVMHSIATMAERLRHDAGQPGLVTANGGYITKHAFGVYSAEPPSRPFQWQDVQDEVDALPTREVCESFDGEVAVEAYTVMHGLEGAERALFGLRLDDGRRAWGSSTDTDLMAAGMETELIGHRAQLSSKGVVRLG